MEPNRVITPCIINPVAHHNSDRPNSDWSSIDLSQDEDHFNMDRNWEHGLVIIFPLYFAFSIKCYFIDFQHFYLCSSLCHMVSNYVLVCDINIHTNATDTWQSKNIKTNPCSQFLSMLKSSSSGDESQVLLLLLGPSEL